MAEYWIAFESGDESNDGLSENAPKKYPPGYTGSTITQVDDNIYNIRTGETLVLTETWSLSTAKSRIKIRGYGYADNVLELTLPDKDDPSILRQHRVARQMGVHQGMFIVDGSNLTGTDRTFTADGDDNTDIEVCDGHFIGQDGATQTVRFGLSVTTTATRKALRRCLVEGGLNNFASSTLNTTVEDCKMSVSLADGIRLAAATENTNRQPSVDIVRRVHFQETNTSGGGDFVQRIKKNGTIPTQNALFIQQCYGLKTSPGGEGAEKQWCALNTTAYLVVEGNHFLGPDGVTGGTGINIQQCRGYVRVSRNYVRAGQGLSFVREGTSDETDMTADEKRISIAGTYYEISNNVIVLEDYSDNTGIYQYAGRFVSGTNDITGGTMRIVNNTIVPANASAYIFEDTASTFSCPIGLSRWSSVTIDSSFQLDICGNRIMVGRSGSGATALVMALPSNLVNSAQMRVEDNVVFTGAKIWDTGSTITEESVTTAESGNSSIQRTEEAAVSTDVFYSGDKKTRHFRYALDARGRLRENPPAIGAYEPA